MLSDKVVGKPAHTTDPPPPPPLIVTVAAAAAEVPVALLAVAVKVVVALTVMGPTVCVVIPAAPVPVHVYEVGAPPAVQFMVSVAWKPAACALEGAPEMLQPDGAAGGVVLHVTVWVADADVPRVPVPVTVYETVVPLVGYSEVLP